MLVCVIVTMSSASLRACLGNGVHARVRTEIQREPGASVPFESGGGGELEYCMTF